MYSRNLPVIVKKKRAWNKGRIVGQKRPLLPKHVWAIRVRLELAGNTRDLALFNMAVDSKLRGCDLVRLKVVDVYSAGRIKERTSVLQRKTSKPVQFEITECTRKSLAEWIDHPAMIASEYLWPGRFHERDHISTRQYARLVKEWVTSIGLEPSGFGTHSLRRTKAAQIYKKTGNLRAVQLLLGHTKMDSTVRYLGVDLEDALTISEGIEIQTARGRYIDGLIITKHPTRPGSQVLTFIFANLCQHCGLLRHSLQCGKSSNLSAYPESVNETYGSIEIISSHFENKRADIEKMQFVKRLNFGSDPPKYFAISQSPRGVTW